MWSWLDMGHWPQLNFWSCLSSAVVVRGQVNVCICLFVPALVGFFVYLGLLRKFQLISPHYLSRFKYHNPPAHSGHFFHQWYHYSSCIMDSSYVPVFIRWSSKMLIASVTCEWASYYLSHTYMDFFLKFCLFLLVIGTALHSLTLMSVLFGAQFRLPDFSVSVCRPCCGFIVNWIVMELINRFYSKFKINPLSI